MGSAGISVGMGSVTIAVGSAMAVSMPAVASTAIISSVALTSASSVAAISASAVEGMAVWAGCASSIMVGVGVLGMSCVVAAPGSGSSTARVMKSGESRYQPTGSAIS